jgi:dolichol-phosphate mannosyltransferase
MLISIVVPCYNESDNVDKLNNEFIPIIKKLASSNDPESHTTKQVEVVFVDDGSVDNTYQSLIDTFSKQQGSNLIYKFERHPQNRGLGAALRTGFIVSRGDIIITVDSDGTYRYAEIPALLSCMTSDVDIVTASPYHPSGRVDGVPAFRIFLSKGSSLIYRILLDWRIHTYTSLFRAYRSEVIKNITFDSDGYLAGTELMIKAMLLGYHVVEYPTVLYRRMYGVSKAKIARTIYAHLQFQTRLLFHRLGIVKLVDQQGASKSGKLEA